MRARSAWVLLAWAGLVVAVYYRRVWVDLASGPVAWSAPSFGFDGARLAFPFFRDALLRAARGAVGAGIVTGATLAIGRVTARCLAPGKLDPLERGTLVISSGLAVLGLLFCAIAFAGLYRPAVVVVLTIALAGLGAYATFALKRTAGTQGSTPSTDVAQASSPSTDVAPGSTSSATVAQGFGPATASWFPPAGSGLERWSRALVLIALALSFFCALAPESEYDALWYHLELPRRWMAAGHPVDDVSQYVSLYPLHWELVLGAVLPLGGTVGARLLHWMMLAACAAASMVLARRLDAPPWLSAAVFVTAPTIFWEGTAAYADLALTLHVAVGTWALLKAHDEDDRRWLVAAGVAFGGACATKHLGLVALAAALIVAAFAGLRSGRPVLRTVRRLAGVLALALAFAAPWYAWAAARSGNPVFPEMYRVFGSRPPERWSPYSEEALGRFKAHFGRTRTAWHQLTLPWDMTMHAAEYGGTFGPLLLAVAPAVVLVSARRPRALALAAGCATYFAVWASPLSSFQARFLVPAWLPASALVAAAISQALPTGAIVSTAVVVLLAMSFPPAIPLHEADRVGWQHWLTHVVHQVPAGVVLGGISQDEYLRRQIRSYAAWRWIDAHLPPDAHVLSFSGGDEYYSHRARTWSDSEVARRAVWAAAGEHAAMHALDDLGITHVLVPQPWARSAAQEALALIALTRRVGPLREIYEDHWYALYRVDGAGSPTRSTDQR